MPFILNVHAGSLVFLDCGCHGYRMPSRPEQPVLVIVERPCEQHRTGGHLQLRYIEPLVSVSPFSRVSCEDDDSER